MKLLVAIMIGFPEDGVYLCTRACVNWASSIISSLDLPLRKWLKMAWLPLCRNPTSLIKNQQVLFGIAMASPIPSPISPPQEPVRARPQKFQKIWLFPHKLTKSSEQLPFLLWAPWILPKSLNQKKKKLSPHLHPTYLTHSTVPAPGVHKQLSYKSHKNSKTNTPNTSLSSLTRGLNIACYFGTMGFRSSSGLRCSLSEDLGGGGNGFWSPDGFWFGLFLAYILGLLGRISGILRKGMRK